MKHSTITHTTSTVELDYGDLCRALTLAGVLSTDRKGSVSIYVREHSGGRVDLDDDGHLIVETTREDREGDES